MKYDLKEKIREFILQNKETDTTTIVEHYVKRSYTKQGVYKCLNTLLKDEVIVWKGTTVAINLMYAKREIDKLTDLFNKKQILLKPIQGATYKIKSLKELDDLFTQIFIQIVEGLNKKETYDFLFYDVHNYTYINKQGTVNWYIEYLNKLGRVYLLVGSKSLLDIDAARSMNSIKVYNIDKKWNYYISVLGDYVIHNYIDKNVMTKMSLIMNKESKSEAEKELKELELIKGSFKIEVKKDREEASKINKYFRKYFAMKVNTK